jgi:shikimate dehydrogenase
MQNAALAQLGLAGEWAYEAIDVAPDEFEARVRAMPGEDFVGANITIPHKEAAFELAGVASDEAVAIGAANTLRFARGQIHASNTDTDGLLQALPGSPKGKRALVLGAGGAARAAIWALSHAGATVDVWNRSSARGKTVYEQLRGSVRLDGAPVEAPAQQDYGIVVNTTSVGLRGENPFDELPLDPSRFGDQLVVDLVYGDHPTKLVQAAMEVGAPTVDGLEILVQQGARSLEIWTGRKAPTEVMRVAAREGLSR